MEKKNNNKILIVLIVVLLLGFLGVSLLYIYNPRNSIEKDKDKTGSFETTDKDVEIDTEKDITDALLRNDLSSKVFYLINNNSELADSNTFSTYFFRKSVFNNNLNFDQKLEIVLASLEKGQINSTTNIKIDSDTNSTIKNMLSVYNVLDVVSVDKVEERYYDLFGEKISNHHDINGCPIYYYDSTNRVYYVVKECGGTSDNLVSVYKNRYTIMGNEAYVYMNIGISNRVDFNRGDSEYNIYKDFNIDSLEGYNDKIYKTVKYSEKNNFIIDDSNKDEFAEYKFTFVKNSDGIYNFTGVKKVEK